VEKHKAKPKWDVVIGQYSRTGGNCIRRFALQVMANTCDEAKQAALEQINKWALGDFSVNVKVEPNNPNSAALPYMKYGSLGARNRIISVKRTW
jgi:hypothetical protein